MEAFCFFWFFLFSVLISVKGIKNGTVTVDGKGNYQYMPSIVPGVAQGSFETMADHSLGGGFGVLKIETNSSYTDYQQMFAAGFLEGALTAAEIYDNYVNVQNSFGEVLADGPPKCLTDFLSAQDAYLRGNVASLNSSVPFWSQLGLIFGQYDGLVQGYTVNHAPNQDLAPFAFQLLNGNSDFGDIITAVCPRTVRPPRPDFTNLTRTELDRFLFRTTHCSALVKLTGDFSNLFMSHSTWASYQFTDRVMKHYNFRVTQNVAQKISFSSYPGQLESVDDFYITGARLVVLETTNNVFNESLFKLVTPQSAQAWHRMRVAMALSSSGLEWVTFAGTENGGTYNNQYMIIDLKLFKPGQPLKPGTLWVAEQVPGYWISSDQTELLGRGYWSSYNVPFHEFIYNISGYPGIVQQYGPDYSYDLAPRAKIFRRDQGTVVDMPSFKALMRANNYKTDPYSEGTPTKAICARGDLVGGSHLTPSTGGCYDTKVTDYVSALQMISEVVNGPTTGTGDLPFFTWAQFPKVAHEGLPYEYNFSFEVMDPRWT